MCPGRAHAGSQPVPGRPRPVRVPGRGLRLPEEAVETLEATDGDRLHTVSLD